MVQISRFDTAIVELARIVVQFKVSVLRNAQPRVPASEREYGSVCLWLTTVVGSCMTLRAPIERPAVGPDITETTRMILQGLVSDLKILDCIWADALALKMVEWASLSCQVTIQIFSQKL